MVYENVKKHKKWSNTAHSFKVIFLALKTFSVKNLIELCGLCGSLNNTQNNRGHENVNYLKYILLAN